MQSNHNITELEISQTFTIFSSHQGKIGFSCRLASLDLHCTFQVSFCFLTIKGVGTRQRFCAGRFKFTFYTRTLIGNELLSRSNNTFQFHGIWTDFQGSISLTPDTYAPGIEKLELSTLAEMKYKSPLIALYISRIPHQWRLFPLIDYISEWKLKIQFPTFWWEKMC